MGFNSGFKGLNAHQEYVKYIKELQRLGLNVLSCVNINVLSCVNTPDCFVTPEIETVLVAGLS